MRERAGRGRSHDPASSPVCPRLFPGFTRDLAAFPPEIRGPLTERSPAPIRLDADFEIRDKRDEGKMVGLETSRVANVVVFGKARKVVGGEHDRPHEVLSGSKAMTPLDKPPHPLKLSEVLDWTVSYADPPCVWLVTLRAWYRLGNPSPAYLRTFAGIQRRTRFVRAVAAKLREDFHLSCDAALDAMAACDVVEGDLLDPTFRGAHAANVAAKEAARAEAEKAAREAGLTGREIRAAGDAAERTAEGLTPLRYTRRAVMEDAAFVAAQIEGLRRSGGLVPGDELTQPACVSELQTILAKTRKEEAVAERRARSNAARAAQRAAQRERENAKRAAAGVPINTNKPLSQIEKARLAMADLPPREPRTAPPPPAEGVVPDAYGAPHALINETLTLWDLTQTHGGYLKLPPCPWWRFARAFLEPRGVSGDGTGRSETTDDACTHAGVRPSDAALVRDVCVALVRVAEGHGPAGFGAQRLVAPATSKSVSELEDPDDLRMLDWAERVGVTLSVYSRGIDGAGFGNTWPSEAVRVGATAAAEALSKSATGDGVAAAAALRPAERVALAAALACVACDNETFGSYVRDRVDDLHAAHRLGKLRLAPSKARPKQISAVAQANSSFAPAPGENGVTPDDAADPDDDKPSPSDAAVETPGATDAGAPAEKPAQKTTVTTVTTRPDWAESLIEWCGKAADRAVYLRSRPIARDETGRRYFVLGGAAGANMVFLEEPSPAETDERRKEEEEEREEEAKLKAEAAAADSAQAAADDDDAVEAKEAAARAKAELRAKQVAAKSRACILRGKAKDKRIAASGEFGDWPARWRCYKPGASLKRLRDWLDDDPRNPRGGEEKRLKSLSALLVKAAATHDKKGGPIPGDVDEAGGPAPASQQIPDGGEKRKFDWDALAKELGINVDGYAHLDDPTSKEAAEVLVPEAEQRDAAATALCSVVRHALSSVTAFWKQKPPWLFACLNLLSALPDALGTGNAGVGAADAAGDRLSVLVARVMPPLEAMLRASQALTDEWLERREAWFTGLRGAEDFDLRVPPPELMSYEEAEAAVANAAAVAAEAIEFSTTDEALDCAVKLSVARSARLLATLCAAIKNDPHRLTHDGFLAATPPAAHPGIAACRPGATVALLRKGMKLTRDRYLDPRATPEGWIPLKELRPVERAVVRAVAYRGGIPAPPGADYAGTPPCCWVLLELLDPPLEQVARGSRWRKPEATPPSGGPRLVSAPVFAGGEIADYIIDWDRYDKSARRPWSKGARIIMEFDDGTVDVNAPGAVQIIAPQIIAPVPPPAPPPATANPEGSPAADVAGADVAAPAPMDVDGATPAPSAADAVAVPPGEVVPGELIPGKTGIIMGENGKEFWLGRVHRVRGGDDPWENTMVVFDSDPEGDEPMWVCPWEIELAPEKYQPKEDPAAMSAAIGAGDDDDDDERSAENQLKVDSGTEIAERLGWPHGVAAAREEFNNWRMTAAGVERLPRAPTFAGAELDLYKVLVEVMCRGGYELVTNEKRWKTIAKLACPGKDLTTQTSASFALRTNYQRFLLDLETWLWENADTLGPRPAAFTPAEYDADANTYDADDGAVGGANTYGAGAKVTFTMNKKRAPYDEDDDGDDEEKVSEEGDEGVPEGEDDYVADEDSDEGDDEDDEDEDDSDEDFKMV